MVKKIGKGLASLIGESDLAAIKNENNSSEKIVHLDINSIQPNPDQPRKNFPQQDIEELSTSIKNKGILSPVLVTKVGDKYQIVAGERRYHAAKLAEITNIPAIIKTLDKQEVFEIALIENIQRKDLTSVEEAEAYKQLIETYKYTHNDLAEIVGKSRSHITNIMRLLSLPEEVLLLLEKGKITSGHARSLIGKDNAVILAKKIVEENLNVRQIEALTKEKKSTPRQLSEHDKETLNDIKVIEELLKKKLQTGVKIQQKKSSDEGVIRIEYHSLEELDGFLQNLSKKNAKEE